MFWAQVANAVAPYGLQLFGGFHTDARPLWDLQIQDCEYIYS